MINIIIFFNSNYIYVFLFLYLCVYFGSLFLINQLYNFNIIYCTINVYRFVTSLFIDRRLEELYIN